MTRFDIRSASGGDAGRLTAIAHAAKRHWGYAEDLIALWARDLTVTAAFIDSHPVFCIATDCEILGFYALSRDESTFGLAHLWIEPGYMRTGLGTALLRHAIETVRSLGGDALEIASDPHAEGFYRRLGARRVGSVASKPPGRELPLLVIDLTPGMSASSVVPADSSRAR